MRVVDASALVDLLSRRGRALGVARELCDQDLCAPELLDAEVISAIARLERADELSASDADACIDKMLTMPIHRVSHEQLTAAAWKLRHRVSTSDAIYVACAARLQAPLVTTDARLSRAPLPGVRITLVQ